MKQSDHLPELTVKGKPMNSLWIMLFGQENLNNKNYSDQMNYLKNLERKIVNIARINQSAPSIFLQEIKVELTNNFPKIAEKKLDEILEYIDGMIICVNHYAMNSFEALESHLNKEKKRILDRIRKPQNTINKHEEKMTLT